jgi:CheY-like chemotaxis protein
MFEPLPDEHATVILVVDDNPVVRETLHVLCEDLGLQVHFAEDGQEALELYTPEVAGSVLMDLQMPELDGFGACRALSEKCRRHNWRAPKFFAMSSTVDSERTRQAMEAGFARLIAKPPSIEDLVELARGSGDSPSVSPASSNAGRAESKAFYPRIHYRPPRELLCKALAEHLQNLEMASSNDGDDVSAAELFHKIQGTAIFLRAGRLRELTQNAERLARTNRKSVPHWIALVQDEVHKLQQTLCSKD